ncbi:hypothetical protein [Candidatus Magnetobacterium casense]|nr:hypothetical protein [Candidatus Magnetobacterium casensis]
MESLSAKVKLYNTDLDKFNKRWESNITAEGFEGGPLEYMQYVNEGKALEKRSDALDIELNKKESEGTRIVNRYFVEVKDGLVPKSEFNKLSKDNQSLLMKVGMVEFTRKQERLIAIQEKFLKDFEVEPGKYDVYKLAEYFKSKSTSKTDEGQQAYIIAGMTIYGLGDDAKEAAEWVTATPLQKFDIMKKSGDLKENDFFAGVDEKTGAIKYITLTDKQTKLYKEQNLDKATPDEKIGSLKMARDIGFIDPAVVKGLPYGLGEKGSAYSKERQDAVNKYWASLPQETRNAVVASVATWQAGQPGTLETLKGTGYIIAGQIPVVGTALNWNRMSTGWKVGSVVLDVLCIASFLPAKTSFGGNIFKLKFNPSTEFKTAVSTAKDAGKAFGKAQEATNALSTMQKLNLLRSTGVKPNIATLNKFRGYVHEAVIASAKADQRFVDALGSVRNLDKTDVIWLERYSKMKGLSDAITDVGKYSTKLEKDWAKFRGKWGTGASSKFGSEGMTGQLKLTQQAQQQYLRDYQAVVRTRQKLMEAMKKVSQSTREGARKNPALMRAEEKLPRWSEQGRGWRKGPQPFEPRQVSRLEPKLKKLLGESNKLKQAIGKVERFDPEIAAGLRAKLARILHDADNLRGPQLDYWTGRISRMKVPSDPGATARAVEKFLKDMDNSIAKSIDDDFNALLKDAKAAADKQEDYLRWKGKDIAEGKPWEMPSGSKVKTAVAEKVAERTKVAEKVSGGKGAKSRAAAVETKKSTALKTEEKVATKEKAATEKVIEAAKEEGESKFGMKPKPKDGYKGKQREIPSEVYGRMTAAQIAKYYGNQAVTEAIGTPITRTLTSSQMRTAEQANQAYQQSLTTGLDAATKAFIEEMSKTQDRVKASNMADAAAKDAVDAETKTLTNTKVKTAVETATLTAIKRMLINQEKINIRKFEKEKLIKQKIKLLPGGGTDLEIKEVRGVPPNPGVISWDAGVVKVLVKPPYREGTEDIDYDRLKVARKGKGSQESTLKVTGGKAPQLLVLGRGFDRINVIKGKRMTHRRVRGPGIIDRQGRIHRQRRGSVI